MLKRILMAAIAAAAVITPVSAEIQPGTRSLIETIENNGILVTVNHPDCMVNGANGQYRWLGFQREMRLCPGDVIDANDHNTVRHETIHAIQHCVNVARGTTTDTPIIQDSDEFANFVLSHLTPAQADWIMENYPEDQWLTELEAFAGSTAYTASELEELFLDACTLQDTDV